MNFTSPKTFFLIAGSLAAFFFVGCEREKIQVYRVEKEVERSPAPGMPPMGGMGEHSLPPPPATEHLEWTLPAGWTQKPPSPMRYGSFGISGKNGAQADFSVVTLAGDAGGVLANINRWRGQLSLSPISESQLAGNFTPMEVLGAKVILVDFVGTDPSGGSAGNVRMLAAILPRGGVTWFFKMTGDDALVESQKTAFTKFLKSLRFTGAAAPMTPPAMPSEMMPPMAGGGHSNLKWKVPTGWKEQAASGMRKGSFLIDGKEGMQADVSVISLPGTAGGILPNVNRWRNQISLPPFSETDFDKMVTRLKIQGEDAFLVDMLSSGVLDKKKYRTRVIGSILVKNGQCWFFKMMGDDSLVESQKQPFIDFVKSLEIPGA